VDDKLKVYTVSLLKFFLFSNLIHFLPSFPLFLTAGSIYATRKVVDVKCFLLFFIGLKESFSLLSWVFFMDEWKRLVTSYESEYITAPIENQLSIYYIFGVVIAVRRA
jgi:hypothetical protein